MYAYLTAGIDLKGELRVNESWQPNKKGVTRGGLAVPTFNGGLAQSHGREGGVCGLARIDRFDYGTSTTVVATLPFGESGIAPILFDWVATF